MKHIYVLPLLLCFLGCSHFSKENQSKRRDIASRQFDMRVNFRGKDALDVRETLKDVNWRMYLVYPSQLEFNACLGSLEKTIFENGEEGFVCEIAYRDVDSKSPAILASTEWRFILDEHGKFTYSALPYVARFEIHSRDIQDAYNYLRGGFDFYAHKLRAVRYLTVENED